MEHTPPSLRTTRRQPISPLFPYTTLFRSDTGWQGFIDNHNAGLEHARSDFDVDHRLVSSFVYNLPFGRGDRKSTRLNSSHDQTSYAVLCLIKKPTCSAFFRLTRSSRCGRR